MQDTIYRFKWEDKQGRHSTTTVGSAERNDMIAYINQMESAGLIWNAKMSQEGEDI